MRIKTNMIIPDDIVKIHSIFIKNSYELFLVGGCVRDHILNIKPKDFDLVTNISPDSVIELLKNESFIIKIMETGKQFGVINVITKDGEYEIATMREDVYIESFIDNRRPSQVVFSDIKTDVLRRDLTCNALYLDISTNEIIDLVNGVYDIQNNIVRTVGNPIDRFNEDKLRILRAIRFAARFDCKLHEDIDIVLSASCNLDGISEERIRDEFIKGINSAKNKSYFINLLEKYDLFEFVFPGLKIHKTIINTIDNNFDYIVIISKLLKLNDIKVLKIKLNELRYNIDEIKMIIFLISLSKLTLDTAILLKREQLKTRINEEQIITFLMSENMNKVLVTAFTKFHLTITGDYLINVLNMKEGKELGMKMLELENINFLNFYNKTLA